MKVILKQDVKKVGKRGEVVEVADGYARNYLIARGLAVAETPRAMQVLKEQQKEEAEEEERQKEEAEKLAEKLAGMTFTFRVKSGKEGRVFGSVSTKQIVEELRKQDIRIDKRKILDTYPISQLGTSKVRVELHKGVIGTINVKLVGSDDA
jgi:large subunit ribosomal protein L9